MTAGYSDGLLGPRDDHQEGFHQIDGKHCPVHLVNRRTDLGALRTVRIRAKA